MYNCRLKKYVHRADHCYVWLDLPELYRYRIQGSKCSYTYFYLSWPRIISYRFYGVSMALEVLVPRRQKWACDFCMPWYGYGGTASLVLHGVIRDVGVGVGGGGSGGWRT